MVSGLRRLSGNGEAPECGRHPAGQAGRLTKNLVMRLLFSLLALSLSLLASGAHSPLRAESSGASAVRYFIDSSHSSVEFSVVFMGIARVTGSFNQFYGTVDYDPENVSASAVDIVIRIASLDTRNQFRDRDLLGGDYFDESNYPVATFRSREAGVRDGRSILTGDLTIRGVTRRVDLPFEVIGALETDGGRQVGAEAVITIDRRDYGLTHGQFSRDQAFIGNEVELRLMMRLREPSPAKRELAAKYPQVDVTQEAAEALVGRYVWEERGFELGVHLLDGELVLERVDTLRRLIPIGENRFRVQDFEALVEFGVPGGARRLRLERSGREPEVYERSVD